MNRPDVISPPLQAASRKVFPADTPISTSYINGIEFMAMGMDVFMDVGIVSPEAVNAALAHMRQSGQKEMPTVDFRVQQRFGMSLQAAMLMHQRLSDLISHAVAQAQSGSTTQEGG